MYLLYKYYIAKINDGKVFLNSHSFYLPIKRGNPEQKNSNYFPALDFLNYPKIKRRMGTPNFFLLLLFTLVFLYINTLILPFHHRNQSLLKGNRRPQVIDTGDDFLNIQVYIYVFKNTNEIY